MTRAQQLEFIRRIAPWAQAAAEKHGVPASVTIAQAILESGWGKSSLAAKHNNFFGIKAARSGNAAVELPTWEVLNGKRVQVTARFRVFASPAECFDWRGRWLSTSKTYARAMADADDPIVFATRLWQCGYATDPNYPKKLVDLIQVYDLGQWDLPAARKRNGGPGR